VWTVATATYSGAHFATFPPKLIEPMILAGSRLGDLVCDPFLGSGTVGQVCERLGRRWVGCDIQPTYHTLSQDRTRQRGLRWTKAPAAGGVSDADD
jgi:site-specific DNA-methyltransferase (cytosine-N4-specific)